MGQTRIALLLALGATLMGANAANEGEAPKTKAEASATVTVTAEASPVELVKTPNPVTVVTTEKLETIGASNLSDLLQAVFPGQVARTGGIGSTSSFMLGGARPQDVVVTIDGIRVNDASGLVGVNASTVNLAGIDRAEIQQGPSSSRFGSEAMGGAIALYSAGSAKEGISGDFRLKGGTSGIVGTTFAPAYGWGSGWVRGSVDLQQQDSNLESQIDYRSLGTALGFGQQVGSNTLVTATYRNSYIGVPLPIASSSYNTSAHSVYDYDETRGNTSRSELLSSTIRTLFSSNIRGELTFGHFSQERAEPGMYSGAPSSTYQNRSNQLTAFLTCDWAQLASLSAGLDASDTHALASGKDAKDMRLAPYLEAHLEPLSNLRFTGSLRWEYDRQDLPDATGRIENSTAQYTGKFGVNYILPFGLRVYTSTGTGFSAPILANSLYNTEYGGEPLRNEKSKFVQTGVSFEHGPWRAKVELSRTLFSSLVYYDSEDGPITYVDPGTGTPYHSGLYHNGTGIRIQSAELSGGYETKQCGLSGFYRNQEARDTSVPKDEQLTVNSVIRRPFQTLGLACYGVLGNVRIDARWTRMGSRYEYAGFEQPAFAYRTHYNDLSLSAAWAVQKNLTFILRGDNLMQPHANKEAWMSRVNDFRNDASQVYGYPAQSPSATAELRYRF